MPTPTYDLIASTTLAASTSSVVFGSLPQTYRDLILVMNGSPSTNDYPTLSSLLNGDSGANYSRIRMNGTGSGSGGAAATSGLTGLQLGSLTGIGSSTTSRSHVIANLIDYSATDKQKTALARFSQAGSSVSMVAGRWANTAAINSIRVFTGNNDFGTGTVMSLYGVIA
jgi:hypothetical protein